MGQNKLISANQTHERRYWVWVTRPEFYLNEQGEDRDGLDPENNFDWEWWWTCHKDTKKGDLALLYRSRLNRDVGYLIQAESDAYSVSDDENASRQGWDYGCDCRVIFKFENPMTLQDIRENPYLNDWGAFRANFQRRVYEIPLAHWRRLSQALSRKNPTYKKFLARVQESILVKSIMLEEELEEALVHDLGRLKPFGYNLELCVSAIDGASGRQLICKGNGGRIDLLCYDRKKKQYVVIELKNVRASQNTFAQISNYVGWVSERLADGEPVIGLVISRGYDVKFESSAKITDRIFHLDLEQIGFE